jgi:hypothetical protein
MCGYGVEGGVWGMGVGGGQKGSWKRGSRFHSVGMVWREVGILAQRVIAPSKAFSFYFNNHTVADNLLYIQYMLYGNMFFVLFIFFSSAYNNKPYDGGTKHALDSWACQLGCKHVLCYLFNVNKSIYIYTTVYSFLGVDHPDLCLTILIYF